MKILVVCQYYYPENFQITPICETLSEEGYEVTVLTGLPNYPSGVISEEYRNGKKRDEIINGVRVIRCHEIPRGKGAIKLALNYVSYVFFSKYKVNSLGNNFDLVFVYQLSPVMMALAGMKYAKTHNVPLFLYCCDLWPESMKMYIHNESNPIYRIIKRISRKIYHLADRIAVQSASFIDYLNKIHGIDKAKIKYIPAFADEKYLEKDFTPEKNGTTNFVFLGNLGIAQNLIKVLESVNMIKDVSGFKVHFVGDGSMLEKMKQYVKDNGLENIVVFYGRRSVNEMEEFYKLADACLVSLKADTAVGLTLPSKVQGYMAAGKPIIGMIEGSTETVIKEAHCGICVHVDDVKSFADAMKSFIMESEQYKNFGSDGRTYFKSNFSKDIFIKHLEDEMNSLIKNK